MVKAITMFVVEALVEFRWIVATLLIAWVVSSAVGSWISDMEQASQRLHQNRVNQSVITDTKQ